MGVDLRLLPLDYEGPDITYSHTVLSFERQSRLWTKIEELPTTPAPRFTSFVAIIGAGPNKGESCYGYAEKDAYGAPLRCVTADALRHCVMKLQNLRPRNHAIGCYLSALPPETRIVLYWH